MKNKIYPRNLTAHLSHNVAGNPAVSRLESSVANCFPGLEMDVRALDRRFFPGLLFDYVGGPDSGMPQHNQQGLKLLYVNTSQEPMLPESATEDWQQVLLDQYNGAVGDVLDDSGWFLHALEQGGNRIEMYQYAYFENSTQKVPYEAETVWWLVRGLSPDEMVTIELAKRDDTGTIISPPVVLSGYRRRYLNEDGSLNEIFQPGEMTESMCSPWTHDFRDCACHYWAASHPDVVLGEVTQPPLPGGDSNDPTTATTYLDWLRSDRGPSGESESAPTITVQRPLRIDHYEINHRWEELAFVLEGREVGEVAPGSGSPILAKPYDSIDEMIDVLENDLAPLELTLAVQYLYALYSLRADDEIPSDRWPALRDDLRMTRQFIMLVAAGEMQHIRWVNHLLWELYNITGRGDQYRPVIRISEQLPDHSKPTLARLEPDVLQRFINYEHPQGEIFRGYARCVATLHKNHCDLPPHLYELAVRIDTDGIDHYTRFREIQLALRAYDGAEALPYLRPIHQGDKDHTENALQLYHSILQALTEAYQIESSGKPAASQPCIDRARTAMQALNVEAERLARDGIGIPFFSVS